VAAAIHTEGADVVVHDPMAMTKARELFPTLTYASSPQEAITGSHVVLHLTEWRDYRELDPQQLAPLAARRSLIDGRNALDPVRWRAAGWTYRGLGRPLA
jgi:UDPglucose 6-dehydrogenase